MKPSAVHRKFKPLFFDGLDRLVLGKANKLYRMGDSGNIELLASLPETLLKRILSRSGFAFRLGRMGFGAGAYFQGFYFFSYGAKIYSYCLEQSVLKHEFSFRVGRGPLSFTVIEGVTGFEDGIYFGEYFGNRGREPVYIYKRDAEGGWKPLYAFARGEINHIHSIVPDRTRGCVWVLAGDFGHSASIWMVKNDFTEVLPILRGDQAYRACVAFPLQDGLLYATDTQITHNSIRLLKCHDGVWVSEHIFDLNGSCIYGCELKDYYVFSTATEPADKKTNFIFSLLDRRPGPGIIKNKSDVLVVRKADLSCSFLFSKKKDILPYRLFQFGAILFPHGVSKNNALVSYSVGNKVNDLSTEVYCLDRG